MIYNKISGSSIDASNTLLFKEFNDEKCYLAFTRSKETWGNAALINISLKSNVLIKDIVGMNSNGKFVDRDTSGYNNENDTRIYLYKTTSSVADFSTTLSNYNKIDELDVHSLSLLHINDSWASIKGLPPTFANFMDDINGTKYYLIRNNSPSYSQNPDNVDAIVKINSKSSFNYTSLTTPAILTAVKDSEEVPAIFGLSKTTNLLGEINIDGLDYDNELNNISPQITEANLLNDYAVDNTNEIIPETPYFILKNSSNQNLVIFDKMYLISTHDTEGETTIWHTNSFTQEFYLLFKVVTISSTFYIKITTGNSNSGLAIYHESLPYIFNTANATNNVSDANPPGLNSTYLKSQQVHNSLFDVKGLVKIKKNQVLDNTSTYIYSKVSYTRQLSDETEKNRYENYGFAPGQSSKRIEDVSITSDTPIIHFGNIKRNPNNINGNYIAGSTRLYLYTNNFVIGDKITIRYYDESHSSYNPLENQDDINISGISYQEDNYYIELDTPTNQAILFNIDSPFEEAISHDNASIVSEPTIEIIKVQYAVCDSYLDALKYNMSNIMIEMKIPKSDVGLYSDIYRQIAICHQPKFNDNGTMTICDSDLYTNNLYDTTNHNYDLGTILFIGNKTPIYRKYLTNKEVFKLII